MIHNLVISGVGGQGVLFLSGLIRKAIARKFGNLTGYDNRGGAQRLGTVFSVVRFDDLSGPARFMGLDFPDREADYILGLEATEALRFTPKVCAKTRLLLDEFIVVPTNYRRQDRDYYTIEEVAFHFKSLKPANLIVYPYRRIAQERFKSTLDANLIMLGEMLKTTADFLSPLDFAKDASRSEMERIMTGFNMKK